MSAIPCIHFSKTGQCKNGEQCTYSHSPASPAAPKPCRDFATSAICKFGNKCKFSHSLAAVGAASASPVASASLASGKPCRDFDSPAGCHRPHCKFAHAKVVRSSESGARNVERFAKSKNARIFDKIQQLDSRLAEKSRACRALIGDVPGMAESEARIQKTQQTLNVKLAELLAWLEAEAGSFSISSPESADSNSDAGADE